MYKYLMNEKGVRFLSVVPTNRTRSNGHELKIRKFPQKTKRTLFFTVSVVKHKNNLPREVVNSFLWRQSKENSTHSWVTR